MASRYDTIPVFNPFIQPAPSELVSQVGLMRETGYIDGVKRIQEYADKASSVDLIKDADKEYLATKLADLSDSIRDVASQDFSNPALQSTIGGLATGVLRDKVIQNGYRGTQQVRRKQAFVEEIRSKHPELYNPANEAYSMMDINQWLNDGQAGSKLVDNKSYYNYYDYSKEVREAMTNYKPSKIRRKTPQGEWIVTTEDASWTDSELREYLNGVLSDRAKQQLRVEGVVAFAGKDDALLASYYSKMKDTVDGNNKSISNIQARLSAIGDPLQKQILTDKIASLKEQNIDYISKTADIDKGDLDFFTANKEGIAEYLMKDGYISGVVHGHSHVDDTVEYTPNDIWRTKFTQSMENARSNARMEFDARQSAADRAFRAAEGDKNRFLESIKLGLKNPDGTDVPRFQKAQHNLSEKDRLLTSKDRFDQEVADVATKTTDLYQKLRGEVLAGDSNLVRQNLDFIKKGGKSGSTDDPVAVATSAFIQAQMSKPKDQRNPIADDYIEQQNALNITKEVFDQQKERIDNQVEANFGKEVAQVRSKVRDVRPFAIPKIETQTMNVRGSQVTTGYRIAGSQTVTGQDILDYLTGAASPSKAALISQAVSIGLGADAAHISPEVKRQVDSVRAYIKDVEKAVGNTVGRFGGRGAVVKLLKQAKDYENGLYDQVLLNAGDWYTPTSTKDPNVVAAINFMQRNYGGTPEEWEVSQVNRTTGEVQFRINPKKSSTINVDLLKGASEYDQANDAYTYKGLNYFIDKGIENLSPSEIALIRALDINTNLDLNGYYTPSGHYDPNGNGQFIQVLKRKGSDGQDKYYLRHEDSKVIIKRDLQDPVSAMNAAKVLTADPQMLQDIIRKQEKNYTVKIKE